MFFIVFYYYCLIKNNKVKKREISNTNNWKRKGEKQLNLQNGEEMDLGFQPKNPTCSCSIFNEFFGLFLFRVSVRCHLSICVSFVVSAHFELLFTVLLHFWEFDYWAFSFISLTWLFCFQFLRAFHVAVFLQNQLSKNPT